MTNQIRRGMAVRATLNSGWNRSFRQFAWSPDGELIATLEQKTGSAGSLGIWETRKFREVLRLPAVGDSFCWDPDSNSVAVADGRTLRRFDVRGGAHTNEIVLQHRITALSFLDVKTIAVGTVEDIHISVLRFDQKEIVHRLLAHAGHVTALEPSPSLGFIASGSKDTTVCLWSIREIMKSSTELDAENLRPTSLLDHHSGRVLSVAWSANEQLVASGSGDGTVGIWSPQGELLRILEPGAGAVLSLSFSANNRILIVRSEIGTSMWRTDRWELLEFSRDALFDSRTRRAVGFHPGRATLATVLDTAAEIRIFDVDTNRLLGESSQADTVSYVNAKVVLVGDSGVGKSGLGNVLAGETFRPTDSTHGRNVWTLRIPHEHGHESREILLWDLAGQPGYRLVHQLSLGDAVVALVVFDARSETDPFSGVQYWVRALKQAQRLSGSGSHILRRFLVSARADRGVVAVGRERIAELVAHSGFEDYFETSAREGWGVSELRAAIESAVDWEVLPFVSSTALFQAVRDFVADESAQGKVLVIGEDLFQHFVSVAGDVASGVDQLTFDGCLARLEARGIVRRFSFGDLILLKPELLDFYAAGIVNAAREEPEGLGSIKEESVRKARFRMPSEDRLKSIEQEQLLLLATIEDLLRFEIALREGPDLIFPAQLTREYPTLPEPGGMTTTIAFEGAVGSIYSTLVVRLAHSNVFQKRGMWRNAATFATSVTGSAGLFLRELEEGRGELSLFYVDNPSEAVRSQFEHFVSDHLEKKAIPETVSTRRFVWCRACGETVTERQVEARRALGKSTLRCPVCEAEIDIGLQVPALRSAGTAALNRHADQERDLAAASVMIDGKLATGDFDVFVSYSSSDRNSAVALSKVLKKLGILPWLDVWELRPGEPWQRAVARQVKRIRSALVILGPSGTGPWQEFEHEAFLQQFVTRQAPVIPVILPGREDVRDLPPFLSLMTWVDFRRASPNPLEQLVWGITGARGPQQAMRGEATVEEVARELIFDLQRDAQL